jgi:UDP-N-acetylmuramate dehydrogenase
MKLSREPLAKHTTLRIGGPAEVLAIPENEEELIETIRGYRRAQTPFRILGNGSNLLVREEGVPGAVIKMTQACRTLRVEGNLVEVGASITVQQFIQFAVRHSLEGLEYLYSVPATVGGAIYMNAGRGKGHDLEISQRIVHVRFFDGESIRTLEREACRFSYRSSIFHSQKDWIILGATIHLPDQPREIGEQRIRERMDHVRKAQDWAYPCSGTVFKKGRTAIFRLMKGHRVGGARFSPKTNNWIQNVDGATASDVMRLIRRAKMLHAFIGIKPELEIEVW